MNLFIKHLKFHIVDNIKIYYIDQFILIISKYTSIRYCILYTFINI
jgi:hypothetical protein